MGRGNWLPPYCSYLAMYDGFYVDLEGIYGEEYWKSDDSFLFEDCYRDFKYIICNEMLKRYPSLSSIDEHRYYCSQYRYVLLENSLIEVIIHEDDTYMAIYIIIPYDCEYENLATKNFNSYIEYLKKILIENYPNHISKRCGPWTSARVA